MTTRADVDVNYETDPRLITVDAPSTEISIQDLHDTLSVLDTKFTSMSHPHTLTTTGKQNLGGGVLVGLTLQLENTQLSFERRTTLISSGTITTDGTIGAFFQTVVDSPGATFIADGVARGYIVVNLTDNSKAEVISIDSETQLTVLFPTGGTDNDYDIGDSYEVWLHETCNISGGNMVAVEADGVTPITSTFPTFGVGIVRTSASSATLQEQADVQFASFGGGVTIDVTTSNTGIAFPVGTPREPVNNTVDAHTILTNRGFDTFFIKGDITVDSGVHPHLWVGQAPSLTTITLDPAANVAGARFTNATITGTLDGEAQVSDCTINDLFFFNGEILQCVLQGTITLGGGVDALILDSWSALSGVTIDFDGTGQALDMQNFNGTVTLTNKSGAETVRIGLGSGDVTIDNTVTAGIIKLHGVGQWLNEATYSGGATIVSELVAFGDTQSTSFGGGVHINQANGVTGVTHPRGTARLPVDNIADALIIATRVNVDTFFIKGDYIFASGDDITNKTIIGQSKTASTITVDIGTIALHTTFLDATIKGIISSDALISKCILDGVSVNSGEVIDSGLLAITLNGGSADRIRFINCYGAGDPVFLPPSIDMGGDGPITTVFRYSGVMTLTNKTGTAPAGFIQQGGTLILDATVTNGIINVFGVINVFTDNSVGATVNDFSLSTDQGIIDTLNSNLYDSRSFEGLMADLLSMASGRIVEGPAGTFKFYERDNSTVRFTLVETAAERNRT